MSHHCHATACTKAVPPEMFMCKRHWFMVPKAVRDRIWATYRPGQCDDWKPSAAYCEAAKAGVIAVAQLEGRAPDTQLYDVFNPARVSGGARGDTTPDVGASVPAPRREL